MDGAPYGKGKEMKMEGLPYGKIMLGVVTAAIILLAVFNSYATIDAGERGILLTFGKAEERILQPGLQFKTPFAQSVVKIDVRTQKVESGALNAASKDLQIVTTTVTAQYHLEPGKVNTIYKQIGTLKDVNSKIIEPAIREAVKATTAQFAAEKLITERELVKEKIKADLKERLSGRDISFEDALITDFDFSPEFNKAIENKVTQEQNALAAKNKLEQVKFEKEQTIEIAKGAAESIRIQGEALRENPQLVSLKIAERWDGKLSLVTMSGGATPLFDISSVIMQQNKS